LFTCIPRLVHLLTLSSAGEYSSGATSIEQVNQSHQLNFSAVHLLSPVCSPAEFASDGESLFAVHLLTSRQLVNTAPIQLL